MFKKLKKYLGIGVLSAGLAFGANSADAQRLSRDDIITGQSSQQVQMSSDIQRFGNYLRENFTMEITNTQHSKDGIIKYTFNLTSKIDPSFSLTNLSRNFDSSQLTLSMGSLSDQALYTFFSPYYQTFLNNEKLNSAGNNTSENNSNTQTGQTSPQPTPNADSTSSDEASTPDWFPGSFDYNTIYTFTYQYFNSKTNFKNILTGEIELRNTTYLEIQKFFKRTYDLIDSQKNKIKFSKNLLLSLDEILYVNYDLSVQYGHSDANTTTQTYDEIRDGKKSGNCGDYSVFLLDMAKEAFGIEGFVLHSGIHMFPIFLIDDGYYATSSQFKKERFSNNLYKLIDSSSVQLTSNFISTVDKTLVGEIQTYLQKQFNRNISPFGIENFDDLPGLDAEELEAKGMEIYSFGNEDKTIIGLKKTLSTPYLGNSFPTGKVSGSFSFSNISTSGIADVQVLGISGINDLSKSFSDNDKFVLGNFTKFLASASASNLSGFGYGVRGHDVKLTNSTYFITKIGDSLKVMGSVGVKVQTETILKQNAKGHKFARYGVKYVGKFGDLSYFQEKIGAMTKDEIGVGLRVGDLHLTANTTKIGFSDKKLDSMLSGYQKELKATYNNFFTKGSKVSVGISDQGGYKSINASFNFKF